MLPSNPPNTSGTARLMVDAPGFAVGWQQPLYVPQPAAGAQWKHTVDGRYFERLIAVAATLTTSAVVGNRFPLLQLTDSNGVVVVTVPMGSTVPATTAITPSLTKGGPAYAFGTAFNAPGFLPDFLIPAGWSWQSAVLGGDVGDAWTGIVLLVQQFPNDTVAIPVNG